MLSLRAKGRRFLLLLLGCFLISYIPSPTWGLGGRHFVVLLGFSERVEASTEAPGFGPRELLLMPHRGSSQPGITMVLVMPPGI